MKSVLFTIPSSRVYVHVTTGNLSCGFPIGTSSFASHRIDNRLDLSGVDELMRSFFLQEACSHSTCVWNLPETSASLPFSLTFILRTSTLSTHYHQLISHRSPIYWAKEWHTINYNYAFRGALFIICPDWLFAGSALESWVPILTSRLGNNSGTGCTVSKARSYEARAARSVRAEGGDVRTCSLADCEVSVGLFGEVVCLDLFNLMPLLPPLILKTNSITAWNVLSTCGRLWQVCTQISEKNIRATTWRLWPASSRCGKITSK